MFNKSFNKSIGLFEKAKNIFPGGVNSPVRACKSVDSTPIFMKSAKGAYLYDEDDNEYIDFVGSWGPMICGHNHPRIVESISNTLSRGINFGTCSELEIKLGSLIQELMPNIEILRFTCSGTEACMAVVRLARAYTKRDKIIKFAGCYHGHYDSFLVQAGSGVATFGLPDSPGVLPNLASETITVDYNNLEQVKKAFDLNPDSIACIIVEPVVGNAGCILPREGFLAGLREICDQYNSLLIFDEVMTGFRVALGGAQERFSVKPDLTTLGKIIGGGLPVGAYCGRAEIMRMVAPEGQMYQAGTLAGNPLAMSAGITTLELLKEKDFYTNIERMGNILENGIIERAKKSNIPVVVNRCGAMLSLFFTEADGVYDYGSAKTADTKRFTKFYKSMLNQGIYLPPSQFEAWFFSSAHGEKEIEKTLNCIEIAFLSLLKPSFCYSYTI